MHIYPIIAHFHKTCSIIQKLHNYPKNCTFIQKLHIYPSTNCCLILSRYIDENYWVCLMKIILKSSCHLMLWQKIISQLYLLTSLIRANHVRQFQLQRRQLVKNYVCHRVALLSCEKKDDILVLIFPKFIAMFFNSVYWWSSRHVLTLSTLPTSEILSGKNAQVWISMVLYLERWM